MQIHLLAGLLASATVAAILVALLKPWKPHGGYWTQQLGRTLDGDAGDAEPSLWQQVGHVGEKRLGRLLPLNRLREDLSWAHLRGKWAKRDEASIIGLAGVGLALGILFGFLFDGGIYPVLFGFLGGYGPFYLVRSAGNEGRKHFRRQFPEMIQALAAEVSTGASLEQALNRVAASQTVVGEVFDLILRRAQGQALFSTPNREGAFRREVRAWNLPELTQLASHLDMIHQRGTYGGDLLGRLARTVADDYLAHVNRKAEGLDNALVMPSVVFFFLPFTIVIFVPLAVSLMSAIM